MLIRLNQVRHDWHQPNDGSTGHEVSYTSPVWINPVLVQFVCAPYATPAAVADAQESEGPQAAAVVCFGPDCELHVLESVDLVLNMIAEQLK